MVPGPLREQRHRVGADVEGGLSVLRCADYDGHLTTLQRAMTGVVLGLARRVGAIEGRIDETAWSAVAVDRLVLAAAESEDRLGALIADLQDRIGVLEGRLDADWDDDVDGWQ